MPTTWAPPRRLLGASTLPKFALIGMMAIHILPMLAADGSVSTAYRIASGRSAALFAVLAEVGLALASGGTTPPRGLPLATAAAGLLPGPASFCSWDSSSAGCAPVSP